MILVPISPAGVPLTYPSTALGAPCGPCTVDASGGGVLGALRPDDDVIVSPAAPTPIASASSVVAPLPKRARGRPRKEP